MTISRGLAFDQQAQPPDSGWDELALEDFKFTSTISSCFVEESVSIPGNAAAIFRNKACNKKSRVRNFNRKRQYYQRKFQLPFLESF